MNVCKICVNSPKNVQVAFETLRGYRHMSSGHSQNKSEIFEIIRFYFKWSMRVLGENLVLIYLSYILIFWLQIDSWCC